MNADSIYGEAARVVASPMHEVTTDDRMALAVAIHIRGYASDRAARMLFEPADREYVGDNDGALQMLARYRLAHNKASALAEVRRHLADGDLDGALRAVRSHD